MSFTPATECVDRELFSELIESPIDRSFLQMNTPSGEDNFYRLRINGVLLWKLRSVQKIKIFAALRELLEQIGFELKDSAENRIGNAVKSRVDHLAKQSRRISNSQNSAKMREGFWSTVDIYPEEVAQSSTETVALLRSENTRLLHQFEGTR